MSSTAREKLPAASRVRVGGLRWLSVARACPLGLHSHRSTYLSRAPRKAIVSSVSIAAPLRGPRGYHARFDFRNGPELRRLQRDVLAHRTLAAGGLRISSRGLSRCVAVTPAGAACNPPVRFQFAGDDGAAWVEPMAGPGAPSFFHF